MSKADVTVRENTELMNLLKIDNKGFKVQRKQGEILNIYTIQVKGWALIFKLLVRDAPGSQSNG